MGGQSGREEATPPPELLHIDVQPVRPGRAVLVLRGELDHVSAVHVRRTVEAVASAGNDDIVLDLRRLSFMDAGGINLLHGLRDRAAGATCRMLDGTGPAADLLRLLPDPHPLPPADVRETAPDQ